MDMETMLTWGKLSKCRGDEQAFRCLLERHGANGGTHTIGIHLMNRDQLFLV